MLINNTNLIIVFCTLAAAGGHLAAVEVLLKAGANAYHKLKDNSTMVIEAARGGHTNCIRAILDYKLKMEEAEKEKLEGKGKDKAVKGNGNGATPTVAAVGTTTAPPTSVDPSSKTG